jgi:hypothetical protein
VMAGDVQSPTSECDDGSPAATSQKATPTLERKAQENADGSSPITATPEDPSIMSGLTSVHNGAQIAGDVINTTATDGKSDAVADFYQTVGDSKTNILADAVGYNNATTFHVKSPTTPDAKAWLDDSLLRPLALKTSPEPDPDEADVWPDAEDLRAAVAYYATEMRDESIAASDEDAKFKAGDEDDETDAFNPNMVTIQSDSNTTQKSMPSPRSTEGSCMDAGDVERCTGSSFGDSSRDTAMEYAAQKQSSIGGAVEEDGFGDIPSTEAASEKVSEAQEVLDSVAHSGRSNAHAVSDAGIVSPSVPTHKPYRSPAAEDSGHPAEPMRQLAHHVRKMNDIIGLASETSMLPPDVIGQFHAVQAASYSMLDALKANKIMHAELHLMTVEPSAGSQLCDATPFGVRCCLCCVY